MVTLAGSLLALGACSDFLPLDDPLDPTPPTPPPDLTVNWLHLEDGSLSPAATDAYVGFIVTNRGKGPAKESVTRVVLEVDDGAGSLVELAAATFETPAIDAGGAHVMSAWLWWGQPVPYGEHRVLVTVDHLDALQQADESNDTASLPISVESPCVDDDAMVAFADGDLESSVAEALDMHSGPVSCGLLQGLETLNASYRGVEDLGGIELAQRLSVLYLAGNRLADLTPLKELTGLQVLDLSDTGGPDLEIVRELESVYLLYLGDNDLESVAVLAGMDRLYNLDIRDNRITDLGPLVAFPSLGALTLDGNPVKNVQPLAEMTQLNTLSIRGLDLDDWSVLGELKGLSGLRMGAHPAFDISVFDYLAELPKLTSLALTEQGITDLSFVTKIPSINEANRNDLVFWDNRISDLAPLVNHPGINEGDYLNLMGNCLDLSSGSQAMSDVAELIARGVTVDVEPQSECENTTGWRREAELHVHDA